jgi:hypothetical protein
MLPQALLQILAFPLTHRNLQNWQSDWGNLGKAGHGFQNARWISQSLFPANSYDALSCLPFGVAIIGGRPAL